MQFVFILNSYDVPSYAGDNTPKVTGKTIKFVIQTLEKVSVVIFKRFSNKQIEGNADNAMSS